MGNELRPSASRSTNLIGYTLRNLRSRHAPAKPVESKTKVAGSGVEIGGELAGPASNPPVAGSMGTAEIPGPPETPPTPPPAPGDAKNGTEFAGVPMPPISPPMDATNGSITSYGTGVSSVCGSGSPASETGKRGSSETWLPQRVRAMCSPSVINVSPTARRNFFDVQKTSSPLR